MNDNSYAQTEVIDYSSFQECLYFLNKYKNLLEMNKMRYEDYADIYDEDIDKVNSFIRKWCKHEYIIDYYETGLDKIEKVRFCKHCELE